MVMASSIKVLGVEQSYITDNSSDFYVQEPRLYIVIQL